MIQSSAFPDLHHLGDVTLVAQTLACSPKHVRRLVDAGKIPGVVRLGRLLRFDLPTVSAWIAQGCPPLYRFDARGATREVSQHRPGAS